MLMILYLQELTLMKMLIVRLDLHNAFKIKDFGEIHYFLGLQVIRTSSRIYLSQRKYALGIILMQDSLVLNRFRWF